MFSVCPPFLQEINFLSIFFLFPDAGPADIHPYCPFTFLHSVDRKNTEEGLGDLFRFRYGMKRERKQKK